MSKYANINDLTSRVHGYYNITIIAFFKSLIFRVLIRIRH